MAYLARKVFAICSSPQTQFTFAPEASFNPATVFTAVLVTGLPLDYSKSELFDLLCPYGWPYSVTLVPAIGGVIRFPSADDATVLVQSEVLVRGNAVNCKVIYDCQIVLRVRLLLGFRLNTVLMPEQTKCIEGVDNRQFIERVSSFFLNDLQERSFL